jgi:hypothetical protein
MFTDSRATRRAWCAAGVVLFVVCVFGCMNAPFKARAVYAPELEFRAMETRDSFNEVIWSDIDKKQPVCPVVVHVPGGDFGDEQLRSAKAMDALGARLVSSEDGRPKEKGRVRVTVMTIERQGAQVSTYYHDDRLVSVIVRVDRPREVTINGKRATLPIARSDMLELFGQPAQMIE